MDDNSNITVGEIDRGYLLEQVNDYLTKIVADIADPNKEPTKKRTLNIQIVFSPSKSRREAEVSYLVTLKPSTHVERKSTIYMGKAEDGTPIAKPYVPNQAILPGVEDALNGGSDSN